jgi:hypothetical protein
MALVHPEARQAVLSALPPAYYEKSFDSVCIASLCYPRLTSSTRLTEFLCTLHD